VNAAGHQAVAANLTLGLAATGLVEMGDALTLTVGAMLTAAGPFSPDADNRRPLNRWLAHRQSLHWWGWPLLVALALAPTAAPVAAYGPVIGWTSHIFPADFVFGRGGQHIPRGIPLWPWRGSRRLGLGLRVTGPFDGHSLIEGAATVALLGVLLAHTGWLIHRYAGDALARLDAALAYLGALLA
jgi:hypothetical protein